ncbi:hypothetical protein LY76DRAFT_589719 [Colletotrichum caudatum]|nr:hypothetical protein LY76DRAFT_589719 [Colletotrichum caudatum]
MIQHPISTGCQYTCLGIAPGRCVKRRLFWAREPAGLGGRVLAQCKAALGPPPAGCCCSTMRG